ncbi:MAG: hypothetical protein R3F14_11210 [Polyangiaceae bacterium]
MSRGTASPGPIELSREASGLRHLRWAREVLGTLTAYLALEEHLSAEQRAAIEEEVDRTAALVSALSAAVKPYRDFLERTRTLARGKLRAAEYLVASGGSPGSGGSGLASPPGPNEAAVLRAEAEAEMAAVEDERRRLHASLERAIDATREGLLSMNRRLERMLSPAFVVGLYPGLTGDGSRVKDDGDPDDDAAG